MSTLLGEVPVPPPLVSIVRLLNKMTPPTPKRAWQNHLDSAQRQTCIAAYHVKRLEELLRGQRHGTEVPIPIQAHFEGAVVASIAAIDKVAQAVNSALKLRTRSSDTFEKAFTEIRHIEPVDKWYRNQFGRDLRRIRVRIAHYSYTKDFTGVHFTVEDSQTNYNGPREILAYARASLEYSGQLCALIPNIITYLEAHLSSPAASNLTTASSDNGR